MKEELKKGENMWSDKELELFKEFRENKVEELTIEHIKLIEKSAISFDGRLASCDTGKLIELVKYLLLN